MKQSEILNIKYINAISMFPDLIKLNNSKLKVEKVLNPPQKPTKSNFLVGSCNSAFSKVTPITMPKIRQAIKFAKKVENGNSPKRGESHREK